MIRSSQGLARRSWGLLPALLVLACSGGSPVATPSPSSSAASPTAGSPSAAASAADVPTPTPAPSLAATDLVYLAMGDSNVYGAWGDCGYPCETYPHILAKRITADTGKSVTLLDESQHNGLDAPTLLDEIKLDEWFQVDGFPMRTDGPSPRTAIAAADLITLTVSANHMPWAEDVDPCGAVYDKACIERVEVPFIRDLGAILDEIESIRAGKPTAVRVTTQYNDLLAGPEYEPNWPKAAIAQAATSARTFLDRWNKDLCSTAEQHGATCVDIYHAINGPKGDKPLPSGWFSEQYGDLNQGGQDYFADAIAKAGYSPLTLAP